MHPSRNPLPGRGPGASLVNPAQPQFGEMKNEKNKTHLERSYDIIWVLLCFYETTVAYLLHHRRQENLQEKKKGSYCKVTSLTGVNKGEVGGPWSRTPREPGKPGGNQGRLPRGSDP